MLLKIFYDKLNRKLKLTKVDEYSASIEINQPQCFCMELFMGSWARNCRAKDGTRLIRAETRTEGAGADQ